MTLPPASHLWQECASHEGEDGTEGGDCFFLNKQITVPKKCGKYFLEHTSQHVPQCHSVPSCCDAVL